MSLRRLVALTGAIALVAMVALAGSATSGAATTPVDIQDSQFVAAHVTVTAGDTVTWTESGQFGHSVTADDGSFDSSPSCPSTCLGHGSVFSHTFPVAGTFLYHCRIHGGPNGQGMSGTVTVLAAVTTTAPTTGPTTSPTTAAPGSPSPSVTTAPAAGAAPAVTANASLTG